MTLEEIDRALPEELHDAQLRGLTRDFENAVVTLLVRVVVGIVNDGTSQLEYRNGEIIFTGVQYFTSEWPDADSAFRDSGCVWFSYAPTEDGVIPRDVDLLVGVSAHRYSFFVREWFASFHIAALEISFKWS
jgi:hypothetical protein